MPNSWTKLRFDKAMGIYLESPKDSVIISTTGRTYRLKDGACTESQAGKNYLLDCYGSQINSEDIIVEDNSKDTFSNAYYVAGILIKEGIKRFHVVTSEFHMKKSRYVFEKIVFPKENGWEILFHESSNGNVDRSALQARLNSEKLVLNFYKNHLIRTFGIIPGNMKTIEKFILNISKAYNPNDDEPYQTKLTRDIKKVNLKLTNPLF
jgi:hypothetical protein